MSNPGHQSDIAQFVLAKYKDNPRLKKVWVSQFTGIVKFAYFNAEEFQPSVPREKQHWSA